MVPQLDHHPVASEQLDEPHQLAAGSPRPLGGERRWHRALAASGEHPPMTGTGVGEISEGELRRSLLPRQVAEAERPGEPGISCRAVGEHQQVLTVRIGHVSFVVTGHPELLLGVGLAAGDAAIPRPASRTGTECDLGAEHRRQPHRACRLGEPHHAVQAVVIGDGERLQAESGRLFGELLRMRRTVEEREVGMTVELGVRDASRVGPHQRVGDVGGARLERLPLAAPCRAIATAVPRRRPGGAPSLATTGEHLLEISPWHVRIVEPHGSSTVSNTCTIIKRRNQPVGGAHRIRTSGARSSFAAPSVCSCTTNPLAS